MSTAVLVCGQPFRNPEANTSRGGSAYATVRDGQGDDAAWWKVLASSDEARDELLTPRSGDGVAISGSFRAEVHAGNGTPRVSPTADRVISTRRAKRQTAAGARTGAKPARSSGRQADRLVTQQPDAYRPPFDMVGQGSRPPHTLPARRVLHRHPARHPTDRARTAMDGVGGLVRQAAANLCRRPRRGVPGAVARTRFGDVRSPR